LLRYDETKVVYTTKAGKLMAVIHNHITLALSLDGEGWGEGVSVEM
jgi:hypothetical protein